jgi:hypothetical protein
MNKVTTCILLVGPESSGTRWLGGIVGQHPDVYGPTGGHSDPLDFYWREPETNPFKDGRLENQIVLTRRSLPSAVSEDTEANYMEFPDLKALEQHCLESNVVLKVLIITRSPEANISSWSHSRASAAGSKAHAVEQYRAAYQYILGWLSRPDSPEFWFLSFEAVLFEGDQYLNSIFRLLGLCSFHTRIQSDYAVNFPHYSAERSRAVVTFSLGEIIQVNAGSKGVITLGDGWAKPEAPYTWSVNGYSIIRVSLDDLPGTATIREELELQMLVHPYTFPEELPSQQLSLSIGGQVVHTANIRVASNIVVSFSSDLVDARGVIEIIISSPTATAPCTIDSASKEAKVISFSLARYSINRVSGV